MSFDGAQDAQPISTENTSALPGGRVAQLAAELVALSQPNLAVDSSPKLVLAADSDAGQKTPLIDPKQVQDPYGMATEDPTKTPGSPLSLTPNQNTLRADPPRDWLKPEISHTGDWFMGNVVERSVAAAQTAYVGANIFENAGRLPGVTKWANPLSLTYKRHEWFSTHTGHSLAGAWAANSVLDMTLFYNRDASWKTMAVDMAVPFFVAAAGRYGRVAGILAGIVPHAAEKFFLEKPLNQ